MRGDPPYHFASLIFGQESTPHARGSTDEPVHDPGADGVYPACAGIHLRHIDGTLITVSLPRMRGDPPLCISYLVSQIQSTPHARGSTRTLDRLREDIDVYPACAGIHPQSPGAHTSTGGLPRMRGDPPQVQTT